MENLIREEDNTSILNKFNLHDELKENYIDIVNKKYIRLEMEILDLKREKTLITPIKKIEKSIKNNRNSSFSKENTLNKINRRVNDINTNKRGNSEVDLKLRQDNVNCNSIKIDSNVSTCKNDIRAASPLTDYKSNQDKKVLANLSNSKISTRRKTDIKVNDQDFGKKALVFENSSKDELIDKKGKVTAKQKETPQEKYLKLLKKIRSNIKKHA